MEYNQQKEPVTKAKRARRRNRQRRLEQSQEEQNRQRAVGGGQPNELGVTQGQNGEQGETLNPRNAQPIGKPGSE